MVRSFGIGVGRYPYYYFEYFYIILAALGDEDHIAKNVLSIIPITSLDDLKNLPKKISDTINDAFHGDRNSTLSDSTIFKISKREYQELGIRIGDKVSLEIKISNSDIVGG